MLALHRMTSQIISVILNNRIDSNSHDAEQIQTHTAKTHVWERFLKDALENVALSISKKNVFPVNRCIKSWVDK